MKGMWLMRLCGVLVEIKAKKGYIKQGLALNIAKYYDRGM